MSSQIRFADDNLIGDPNDLDDLVEATGRNIYSDASEAEEDGARGSGDEERRDSNDDGENEQGDEKKEEKKEKKPRVTRTPQIKLNAERLRGPRGLPALKSLFEDFKFRGKNQRKEDLDRVLMRMEYWAHRLFPKLHFEDFLYRMEKLGTKKEIQVYMKRFRMGLVDETDDGIVREYEDEQAVDPKERSEFDRLLDEQVAYYEENPRGSHQTPKTPASLPSSQTFAPITASTLTEEQRAMIARKKREAQARRLAVMRQREEEALHEAMVESVLVSSEKDLEATPVAVASTSNPPAPVARQEITAEQRERMERNRLIALERRRARMLAEQGLSNEGTSGSQLSQPLAEPLPLSGSTSGETSKPEAPENQEDNRENSSPKIKPANEDHVHARSSPKVVQPDEGIANDENSLTDNGSVPNSSPKTMVSNEEHSHDSSLKIGETSDGDFSNQLSRSQSKASSPTGRVSDVEASNQEDFANQSNNCTNEKTEMPNEDRSRKTNRTDQTGGTPGKNGEGDRTVDKASPELQTESSNHSESVQRVEPMDVDNETNPQDSKSSDGVSNQNTSRESCDFELHVEDTENLPTVVAEEMNCD